MRLDRESYVLTSLPTPLPSSLRFPLEASLQASQRFTKALAEALPKALPKASLGGLKASLKASQATTCSPIRTYERFEWPQEHSIIGPELYVSEYAREDMPGAQRENTS